MNRYKALIMVFTALLFTPINSEASLNDFRAEMAAIVKTIPSNIGIFVVSLDKKEVLFSQNSDAPLNPASTTKLVTSAAILRFLGPDFKFSTKLYLTPQRDLYVYGEGDPSMVIEEVKAIAKKLKRKGADHIRNIMYDDSYFDGSTFPSLGKNKSHYDFYTSAISLNFNRVEMIVTPAKKVGEIARVVVDCGEGIEMKVLNKVTTSSRKSATRLSLTPHKKGREEIFIVSGQVPIASKTRSVSFNVSNPSLFFAHTLKATLENEGGIVSGSISKGEEPEDAKLILNHESKPLSDIIKDMNKFSNNFIAEQLIKAMGARKFDSPGSSEKGVDVLKEYLAGLKIPESDYVLVNGSGLTYKNRMSAKHLVAIIQDMYDDSKLWPHYRDSLSVAGKDGTLKRRKVEQLCNRLMAKTGSLQNVNTLAGTIPSDSGENVGFAILLNGNLNRFKCHDVQDKLATIIAGFRR